MCEEYAYSQIDSQRTQFKRIGVRGDWENPYITLKPEFEASQIQVFGEMAKKGYIYKGLKPVYWSPSSESALAEAEIEYQDKKSPSIYVSFQCKRWFRCSRTRREIRHLDDDTLDNSCEPWNFSSPEFTYASSM